MRAASGFGLSRGILMPKDEWGVKRLCGACGARFYDMMRNPISCPACGAAYSVDLAIAMKNRLAKATASKVVADVDDDEEEEDLDVIERDEEEEEEEAAIVEDDLIVAEEEEDDPAAAAAGSETADATEEDEVLEEDDIEEDVLLADEEEEEAEDDLGDFSGVGRDDKDV